MLLPCQNMWETRSQGQEPVGPRLQVGGSSVRACLTKNYQETCSPNKSKNFHHEIQRKLSTMMVMIMIMVMMVVMKKMIWKRVRGARSMSTNLRGGCCLFSSVCPPSAFVNIITVLVIVTVIIIIVGLGTRDVLYGQCPIFTFFTLHLNILGEYVVGKKITF